MLRLWRSGWEAVSVYQIRRAGKCGGVGSGRVFKQFEREIGQHEGYFEENGSGEYGGLLCYTVCQMTLLIEGSTES